MSGRTQIYELLAQLLSYPTPRYPATARECARALRVEWPDLARDLERFANRLASLPLNAIEEEFTRTFDLNPVCCLEIGWHLFGEDYNRGEFLVTMRRQLRKHGVAETLELPDHLSHVLRLLGAMDSEAAKDLSETFLFPALRKMLDSFARQDNPFADLLRTVSALVQCEVGRAAFAASPGGKP